MVYFKITNGLFCHYCYKVIISYFSKITKSETARKCSKEKPESFGDPYCYNYVYWLKKMLMVSQNECSRTTITSAKMKVEMLLISTSHLDGSTLDFLHIFGGCLEQFSQTSMDGCMDLRITSPQISITLRSLSCSSRTCLDSFNSCTCRKIGNAAEVYRYCINLHQT